VEINLLEAAEREQSVVLHRVRLLGLPGYKKTAGTDFAARGDLTRLFERWEFAWSPEFEAACIEAAPYGGTLEEATTGRIAERLSAGERNAAHATGLLLDAALAGLAHSLDELCTLAEAQLHADSAFLSVGTALGDLLYLYRYDEALGVVKNVALGTLLAEAFRRSLWLLESLTGKEGKEEQLDEAIGALTETTLRAEEVLPDGRGFLTEVLQRVATDTARTPHLRGAAWGALRTLDAVDTATLTEALHQFTNAELLGDFLAGLFALARNAATRDPALVRAVDNALSAFDDGTFLQALPPLRLAFSCFTPREKSYLAKTLLGEAEMPQLTVTTETAARALALETRLKEMRERFGVRG
jgi:hypothetical protein